MAAKTSATAETGSEATTPDDEASAPQVEESEASEPLNSSDVNEWLPGVLNMLAKTQRDLAQRAGNNQGDFAKHRNLSSVKIEEFYGDKGTSAYSYRQWKKSVEVTRRLHNLDDKDLANIIYTQLKGSAKKRVDILELTDLERPDILQVILGNPRPEL